MADLERTCLTASQKRPVGVQRLGENRESLDWGQLWGQVEPSETASLGFMRPAATL